MFASGADQSGYVLKSIGFREFQVMPNSPGDWSTKRERKNVSFSIDVISAQQLMRPYNLGEKRAFDPYVEVEVFLADDKRNKLDSNGNSVQTRGPLKYRTKIIKGNGFNPEFDNKFNFNITTKYPDLVFVRWSVKLADKTYSERAPPLATFTAKLASLKQGYRTLPLLDHKGDQYLFSTLFCRIKVDITSVLVPVPDGDSDSVNKFRAIGRPSFFNRSNQSPKSSIDSGQS
jgi:phosphatidylinositol phospholipase C delta